MLEEAGTLGHAPLPLTLLVGHCSPLGRPPDELEPEPGPGATMVVPRLKLGAAQMASRLAASAAVAGHPFVSSCSRGVINV